MDLIINGTSISYDLIYEQRKTFAAHAYPQGTVIIKSPIEANNKEVENFIKRKSSWIAKQINYFAQFNKHKNFDASNGSEGFYLGGQYKIVIKKASLREYVEVDKFQIKIFTLFPNNSDRIKNIYDLWIEQSAKKEFTLSLKRCLKKFPDLPFPNLKIRKMLKRWGSYAKPNIIILNPALIYTSKKCIDYVVTHELCHHYHKNHSSEFYSLLGSKIPNWNTIKEELEKNSYLVC